MTTSIPETVERPANPPSARLIGSAFPPVLDPCCGTRMFWFDKADGRALFVDKRREQWRIETRDCRRREIVVNPDQLADFTALPFPDDTFALVVFDPPHSFNGKGIMGKLYGTLAHGWREEISAGFAECFRVLCPLGTLIFKWNEHRVPVSTVLALTPEKPLFGQRCGTTARTHWIVFMKQNTEVSDAGTLTPELKPKREPGIR